MRYNLLFYLMAVVVVSCSQIRDPLRNKIVFRDEINQVSDSILNIQLLLDKLPKDPVINCFIDREGYLYVNNKKVGFLKEALNDPSVRSDSVFKNFSNDDFTRFISITVFLLQNHIDASRKDIVSGMFVHGYRRTEENVYNDVREIMVNIDTTSSGFMNQNQILDRTENLVLVAPLDADIH